MGTISFCCCGSGPCFGDVFTQLYLSTVIKGITPFDDFSKEQQVNLPAGEYCLNYDGGTTLKAVQGQPNVYTTAWDAEIDLNGNGSWPDHPTLQADDILPTPEHSNTGDVEIDAKAAWRAKFGDGLRLEWNGGLLIFRYTDGNAVPFQTYYQAIRPIGDVSADPVLQGPRMVIRA